MPVSNDPVYINGWGDPLSFGGDGNLAQVQNEDCIATDIFSILDERKGEWLLSPNHGTTVHQELFDPNDAILAAKIQSKVVAEVSAQEDRVTFGKVSVTQGLPATGQLLTPTQQEDSDRSVTVVLPFFVKQTARQKAAILTLQKET